MLIAIYNNKKVQVAIYKGVDRKYHLYETNTYEKGGNKLIVTKNKYEQIITYIMENYDEMYRNV